MNGEGISASFPRMSTEGAMPNIWWKVRVKCAESVKSAAWAAAEIVRSVAIACNDCMAARAGP